MTAERASATPFYLQDETGRIVVDPTGAEFHVTTTTRDGTSDLLTSLGIASAASWLGGNRTRVIEQLITDQAPLLVVGERVSLAESPLQRQERLRAYIESVKKDPAKMAAADLDGDGILNADEWDAFRRRLESEFTQADLQRSAQTPTEDQVMIRAPVGGKFVISTQSADALEKSLQWQVPMSIAGGIAASALGVWLAIINHWSAFLILGLIAVSFVASLFVKGEDLWSWFSW